MAVCLGPLRVGQGTESRYTCSFLPHPSVTSVPKVEAPLVLVGGPGSQPSWGHRRPRGRSEVTKPVEPFKHHLPFSQLWETQSGRIKGPPQFLLPGKTRAAFEPDQLRRTRVPHGAAAACTGLPTSGSIPWFPKGISSEAAELGHHQGERWPRRA